MVFGFDLKSLGLCRGSKCKPKSKDKNKDPPLPRPPPEEEAGSVLSHHSDLNSSYHSATMGSLGTEGTDNQSNMESTLNLPKDHDPPLEGASSIALIESDLELGTGYISDDSRALISKEWAIEVKAAFKGGEHKGYTCDCNCCWCSCTPSWGMPGCQCTCEGADVGLIHNFKAGAPVLNKVYMQVERGTIYTLLGPTGCGKTPLVSCILGLKTLDEGTISIFGKEPRAEGSGIPGWNVGYMPQEISLYFDFTSKEMVSYYATLMGVKFSDLWEKFDYLFDLLELPCPHKRIKKLTIAQQRRVSFLLAVMFSPELLVLDEPFVGVDFQLRKNIWSYLKQLSAEEGVTILISTHVAEEARDADMIGLMRGGRMLMEASPTDLLSAYNCYLLNDVIVKMYLVCDLVTGVYNGIEVNSSSSTKKKKCMAHSNNNYSCPCPEGYDNSNNSTDFSRVNDLSASRNDPRLMSVTTETLENQRTELKKSSRCSSCRRLYALTWKNLMLMLRNWLYVLFLIFTPALLLVIVLTVVGHDPIAVPLGVVNLENPNDNSCFSMDRNNYKTMKCVDFEEGYFFGKKDISCQFLAELDRKMISLTKYKCEKDALDAVKDGIIMGYLVFPQLFSENVWERLKSGFFTNQPNVLEHCSVQMRFDQSNKQVYMYIVQELRDAMLRLGSGFLSTCNKDVTMMQHPLTIKEPIYGHQRTDFRAFVAPGILLAVIFFFPMFSSAISYLYDKRQGTLKRGIVSGIKIWESIVSFFLMEIIILLIQLLIVFFVFSIPYGFEVKGCYALVVFIAFLVGLAGISLGFAISGFARDEIEAVILVLVLAIPGGAMSAVMWPIEGMPVPLRYVAYIFPKTWSNEAFRSIMSRGWGIKEMEVWLGILVPCVWIIGLWIVTACLMRSMRSRL